MGQLVSAVFGGRRAAARSPASPPVERDERGRVRDRAHARVSRMSLLSERRIGQTAFFVHVFDATRDPSVDLTQPHAYRPTAGVDFLLYRANHTADASPAVVERMHVWDVADTYSYPRTGELGLAVVCYSVADRGSLERLPAQLERARKRTPDHSIVLLGLRCDEPRAVTLEDACAFAEQQHVRCFGTDFAELPIAYDEWAGGRIPGMRRADADIDAYDARIDWRAAFQHRRGRWRSIDSGCGNGCGSVVCAPVIEVSTRELTADQAAWLRELLHELAVEVALMHQPGRLSAG